MKITINSNSVLVLSVCLVGSLLFASSCSESKSIDSAEVAEQENINKVVSNDTTIVIVKNDNDAKFLMKAAEMQLEEISLGKLAQQKESSPHVKELGKMMEEDHTKSFTELQELAQSKSISIPTTITEDSQDVHEELVEKTGNDFGKAYSDMMVEHHEDAIELFKKAATDSEDPDIRAWAAEKLPGLRTHLEHAEACKEECDNLKS